MVTIPFTAFIDFSVRLHDAKLSVVREVFARPEYNPAFDFWRDLRRALERFHRKGVADKAVLDAVLERVKDPKKKTPYAQCIAGYKKFLGKKATTYFEPPDGVWMVPSGTARILVKPELGLEIAGVRHVIKLYLRRDAELTRKQINPALLLMSQALRGKVARGTSFAVLDVPRGKLYADVTPDVKRLPLLIGEVETFRYAWEALQEQETAKAASAS